MSPKITRKYQKSRVQREKERARRRKLRNIVLSHPHPFSLTQTQLAQHLGCSQPTVSRDLATLRSSRWGPFRQHRRAFIAQLRREQTHRAQRWREPFDTLPPKQRFARLTRMLGNVISRGPRSHVYPINAKPRGKAFTSEYQPRWGRWGQWSVECDRCGWQGTIRITGSWQRGETKTSRCSSCGFILYVTRLELQERRYYNTPCGLDIVITSKPRWPSQRILALHCDCGKIHKIQKQDTISIQ
jgi:hypothetical protein